MSTHSPKLPQVLEFKPNADMLEELRTLRTETLPMLLGILSLMTRHRQTGCVKSATTAAELLERLSDPHRTGLGPSARELIRSLAETWHTDVADGHLPLHPARRNTSTPIRRSATVIPLNRTWHGATSQP